ncbi:MAG: hypothetical protein L0H33_00895 [Staphylococcus equorum]|nr:hypothetical protein [Staphylococcus equorum]
MKKFFKRLFDRPKKEKNLLVIKVKDIGSVPEVTYEGEQFKYKQDVSLRWTTTEEGIDGGYDFEIKHFKEGKPHGRVITKGFKSPFL